jgi:hypothetical protein
MQRSSIYESSFGEWWTNLEMGEYVMKKTLNLLGVMVFVAISFGTAKAESLTFATTLTGAQQVPPVASPGIGSGLVTLDTVTNLMTVNVSFSGLLSPTTASHIHCCAPPGVNAIVATTVPTFPGFPLGVTAGTYLRTFDLTDAATYNPAFIIANGGTVSSAQAAFIAGLVSGQTYLNIHTIEFPGGEIRGQLSAIPEPATLLLMGTGLMATMGVLRRRRRKAQL